MKRVLLRSALALGAIVLTVLVVAAGVLVWAARSESGLRFVWERVAPRLPQGISVATVEGRLAGPLTLGGIALQTQTLELRIERVELRWKPRALLDRLLDVERLDVRGVDVVQLPAEPPTIPSEPLRLPESIELPVDVRVASASVERVRFRSRPGAEPLPIERASLAGSFDADRLDLRELVVRGPLFDLSGEARVVPRGAYATSGRLDWAVRFGEYPEARGSTGFSGDLELLTVEQRVEAPYDARVDVRVEDLLDAVRLDGDVVLTVQPAAFGVGDAGAETIGATFALRGTLDALDLTGRVELQGGPVDGVVADIAARAARDAVEIRALDFVDPSSSAAVHASGRVAIGPEEPTLELDATWLELRWPMRGEPQVVSDSGSLNLHGTLRDYAVALDGKLTFADGTSGKLNVSGTGDAETLRVDRVDIEALRGRIEGHASVRWAPSLGGSVELTGTDLDPGVMLREWPGRIGARIRAGAAIEGKNVTIAVHELTADGRLRDRPIELDARGGYAESTLRIDALSLRSGATDVTARGTVGNELSLEWQVESPDLGEVWPRLAGSLSARGALDGPRERPHVGVEASGRMLRFMDSKIDDVELDADVDVAGKASSSLTLNVSAAEVQGVAIPQLQLTGNGSAERHALALSTTTSAGSAELALTGAVAKPWTRGFAWSFALDEATLAYPGLAPWALREPATGRVTSTSAELARSCWQSSTAELCVEGTRGPKSTQAQFALSALRFDYFAALLATPARLEGDLSIEGTFAQPANSTPELDVSLRSSPGRLVARERDDVVENANAVEPYTVTFGPAEGLVTLKHDRFEGSLRVPFAEQGELQARASIAAGMGGPFAQRALDGELLVDVASLEFLSSLLTQVRNIGGAVTGDLRVAGTVGKPQLAGSLALAAGNARLPGTNVELEGVELMLAGDGANGLTVNGEARSGGGTLNVDGRVTLAEPGPAGTIAVAGDAFEVVDTVDAQIVVSPDLDLVLTRDGMQLTGSVLVPRARLTPHDSGESAIGVSGDQVIVESGDEAERRRAQRLSATVRLALGDDVHIDGYGLTGRLGGAIEITEKPGETTTATGELRVLQGVYEAYGQKLEIETGRVVFAGGPITDPGVDIRAVRRPAEGIVVGARVRGLLAAPELSLFSEPPMAQQEQLSYLVLGRPLERASASESSAMSRAALALGLRGGNFVSERINQNLGLDSFGIETDPGEEAAQAAFVIGKYLTPSLYVSYGIGLFEPVNTLKLRYAFSPRWRIETESSSNASGGDLIYNIERGR
jgi:translocation and assembly module TamB